MALSHPHGTGWPTGRTKEPPGHTSWTDELIDATKRNKIVGSLFVPSDKLRSKSPISRESPFWIIASEKETLQSPTSLRTATRPVTPSRTGKRQVITNTGQQFFYMVFWSTDRLKCWRKVTSLDIGYIKNIRLVLVHEIRFNATSDKLCHLWGKSVFFNYQ